MELTKGLLQATIVVLWVGYVLVQLVTTPGRVGDGPIDPTGGMDLLVGYVESLPIEALVVPTAVMVIGILGLEFVFVVLRRSQG